MKLLVTGDWHIGVSTYGVLDEYGRNSRLLDVSATIDKVAQLAIDQKVDAFILCGDVFHTNRPSTEEQLVFMSFLMQMEKAQITTRIIIGNHDYNSQLGKGHALRLFQEMYWNHVKIMHETTWEALPGTKDACLFCFYPFAGEKPDFAVKEKYYAHNRISKTLLVCHSHLEGAVVGAEPYEIKSDRATKFKDLLVDCVLAGHFHKPQVLCQKPLAFYPGSIQAVDFNERLDTKGVVLLQTDDMSMEPAGFKSRPMVQLDILTPTLTLDGISVKDAIVKVNVSLAEADAHKFDERTIREQLIAAGAQSIASINLKVARTLAQRDPEIAVDSDIGANFKRYLKQKDYGDITVDVVEQGLQLIKDSADGDTSV